ncbi:MAG TPA: AAA family ATPase, partial [Longimicrobiaceae bacterium]
MQLNAPAVRAPRLATRVRARLGSLHWQLHARLVYRAAATYVVMAAGAIEFTDVLVHTLRQLPAESPRFVTLVALAGFPFAVVGAWFFEVRRDRAGRATAGTDEAKDDRPAAAAPPAGFINNLHAQPTPFVGRERELATVAEALARPGCRLVTVTGPGGVGKTRLALEAADRALPGFAHGVCVVPLAGIGAVDLIAPAVAAALRVPLSGQDDPGQRVVEYLREKRLLLVMDNFEHLTEGAPLVSQVLQSAPGVRVLATSRERLGVPGEHLVALHGMETADGAGDGDALRLFVEGARRVKPGF